MHRKEQSGRERIGGYEVIAEIGHGAFATVFLARRTRLHREVALKRLHVDAPDAALARRFAERARSAATLSHPNIAEVIDCFEHGGLPYVAMEHVRGASLRTLAGTLTPAQVVGLLEQILAALGHAEAAGVVHGDLKPENVLVATDGTVKVVDFGLARAHREAFERGAGTGATVGTPAYMAPEQALGRPEGPRTDIYAAGAIAFELLARRPPFGAAAAPQTVLARHVREPVPSLGPRADPALDAWIAALLAKDPANRPDARAAWRALESIAVEAAGRRWRLNAALGGGPAAPAFGERGRRRRREVVAATAAAVALAAAIALATAVGVLEAERGTDTPAPAPRPAAVERAPADVVARTLRPVIAANRDVSAALRSLAGPPPARDALALVARARAATREAARADFAAAVPTLFARQRRYLARLGRALRDPSPRRVAGARRAAGPLRAAFARLGDALAPRGAASVGGLPALAAWSRAQRQRAVPPAVPPPEPPRPAPPPVATAAPQGTAIPTPTVTPTATPTAEPAPTVAPTPVPPTPTPTPEP